MHFRLRRKVLAISLAAMLAGTATSVSAAGLQAVTDQGLAPTDQSVTVSLVLRLRHEAELENYVRQTATPGSANFQKFLTTAQFAERYGATDAQIAKVQGYLGQHGLQGELLDNHMVISVRGTIGQFSQLFGTPVHNYVSRKTGQRFHRPARPLVMPVGLGDNVILASGLSNEWHYVPHHTSKLPVTNLQLANPPTTLSAQARTAAAGNPTATGVPGQYTVGDVANMYNINPLYQRGITGKGSTLAIVTLATFDPADAEDYWAAIGLDTKPNRITQVHVDGGGGTNGADETTLDVQQAGGLAPQANIIVYDAPNAGSGFVDAFARAVSDNQADSISASWGLGEIFNFAALNVDGARNTDTTDVGDLRAYHQIFLEAAVQGQSMFAASGDSGAYDTVRALGTGDGPGDFNAPLTVDSPASDPYITAAGGTTVPVKFVNSSGQVVLSIDQESVWGWDYLLPFVPSRDYVFSVGGGGGVSVYWRQPMYQLFTSGTERSEKKQTLTYNDPATGPYTYLKLPGNFHGRNLPDISLNADPETGYLLVFQGGLYSSGGTSFVAPQLNGITALLRQSTGHRIGLWNPHMYLLQNLFGYGKWSAFNRISAGNNWFYAGNGHYNPGAGIGTLNVENFDTFLRVGF
ncbi:S53 family peptidase [Rhodanobacter lindaniclasticus]|uniref:Peptidase S53 n=1 Tax=Rhodanobacter lindaniclasticus TaxID=75310 RepID=A0A4V3USA0_9GAMM|nr:S53 family peptidase [Rhodanobacter lindaniclasticus]THD05911.1 peptidase S53 [Rhodanobacter lindaniclasticus]